jgi:hypothetical protein
MQTPEQPTRPDTPDFRDEDAAEMAVAAAWTLEWQQLATLAGAELEQADEAFGLARVRGLAA